jgi:hypothetical protein
VSGLAEMLIELFGGGSGNMLDISQRFTLLSVTRRVVQVRAAWRVRHLEGRRTVRSFPL